jgi:hypothetical protein
MCRLRCLGANGVRTTAQAEARSSGLGVSAHLYCNWYNTVRVLCYYPGGAGASRGGKTPLCREKVAKRTQFSALALSKTRFRPRTKPIKPTYLTRHLVSANEALVRTCLVA